MEMVLNILEYAMRWVKIPTSSGVLDISLKKSFQLL